MAEKKTLLTYAGLKALEEELENLKVVRRKEVAVKIKEAREQVIYLKMQNMMLQKMNSVILKHVLKRLRKS